MSVTKTVTKFELYARMRTTCEVFSVSDSDCFMKMQKEKISTMSYIIGESSHDYVIGVISRCFENTAKHIAKKNLFAKFDRVMERHFEKLQ